MGKVMSAHFYRVRPQLVVLLLVLLCGAAPALCNGTSWPDLSFVSFVQPAVNLPRPPQITAPKVLGAQSAHTISRLNCQRLQCLALTFDDGPNPATTPQVVNELRQAHVSATFFMIGSRVPGNEALLRQMQADGDEIENHSWTHPDFTTLTPAQIHQQINRTQQVIEAAGVPAPTMFRPPYGAVNPTVEANVPLTILLWDEDPQDWNSNSSAQIIQSVEASAKSGGIVDMHDIYHITADAVPQIINDLQAKGFHFVTVSQLLKLTPASHGIFYSQASLTNSHS